ELKRLLDRSADREAEEMLKRVVRERVIDYGPRESGRPGAPPVNPAPVPAAGDPQAGTPAGQFADGDPHFPRPVQLAALDATVRVIHSQTGQRGSGVIVARVNNFVYLLTAAHLVPEGPPGEEVDVQFFS